MEARTVSGEVLYFQRPPYPFDRLPRGSQGFGRVARLTQSLEVRPLKPQIGAFGDGLEVVYFGSLDRQTFRLATIAERVSPEEHQPALLPGPIVTTRRPG